MLLKRILAKILRKRPPEDIFTEAREYFAAKEYKFAYALFKKAEHGFSNTNPEMEQKSAISAGTCASFLELDNESAQHLFRAARLSIVLEKPLSETIHQIDKAAKAILKADDAKLDEISQMLGALYLSYIANHELTRAKKVAANPKLRGDSPETREIVNLSNLVLERSPQLQSFVINWDFLPDEFSALAEIASEVLKEYTSLTTSILPIKQQVIDVKNPQEIVVEVSSSINVTLKSLSLRTGSKGALISKPELNATEASILPHQPKTYSFLVEAHLAGEWTIGPAVIGYEVTPGFLFEVESEVIQIMVNEPIPVLHC